MIRAARVEDLPRITMVRTSVAENHMSVEEMRAHGITEAKTAADMASGDLGLWVAEADGGIVAFSSADRRNAMLWALFTLPGHEGKGHGSALLEVAETWLRQQGCTSSELYTEKGSKAEGFYLRRGWRPYTPENPDPRDTYLRKAL